MVDHLEPYRQMARSIRFVPPLYYRQPPYRQFTEPFSPPVRSAAPPTPHPTELEPAAPPLNLADHTAALIHAAVSQPTTVSPIYVVQENIGDRISRLVDESPLKLDIPVEVPTTAIAWMQPSEATISEAAPVTNYPSAVLIAAEPDSQEVSSTSSPETTSGIAQSEITQSDIAQSEVTQSEPVSTPVTQPTEPQAPDHPIASWLGSVANYLEQVTEQLIEPHHSPKASQHSDSGVGVCPHCGSTDFRKNGRRSGKPKYVCKTCNQPFTEPQVQAQPTAESTSVNQVSQPAVPDSAVEPGRATVKSSPQASTEKKSSRGFGAASKSKKSKAK